MQTEYHIPVLLSEVLEHLHIKKGGKYIDATLGAGGHTFAIVQRGGVVLGIDCDDQALSYVRTRWEAERTGQGLPNSRLTLSKGNFRDIDTIAKQHGFETVLGILFDLGVSSNQIDQSSRGFSFLTNGPLDMRMDQSLQLSAKDLVHVLTKNELRTLFEKLGEEHKAEKIASEIVASRSVRTIETTDDLVHIIERALGYRQGSWSSKERAKISKKVFQALRIAVNDELKSIEETLPKAITLLAKGGRLAVITFHSLEDRIVKEQFLLFEKQGIGKILTRKPIVPNTTEERENSRSRSAKLRIFEKN